MYKILISSNSFGYGAETADLIRKFNYYNLVPYFKKIEEAHELLESIDGLIVGTSKVTREIIDRMKNLKSIVKYGTGIDNIDIDYAQRKGIIVKNLPSVNSETVAEFTVGMMFAAARRIPQANINLRQGKFVKIIGHRVTTKTVGIIGTGAIGKAVARMCKGLGMKVMVYDIFKDEEWAASEGFNYVDPEDLLINSDFVTLHVPLTPETKNLIDEKEISMMKKTAYILNISRGGIINETALYNALTTGKIAGAALDVFSQEPPAENLLIEQENVVSTPHMAAHAEETLREMDEVCIKVMADSLRVNVKQKIYKNES